MAAHPAVLGTGLVGELLLLPLDDDRRGARRPRGWRSVLSKVEDDLIVERDSARPPRGRGSLADRLGYRREGAGDAPVGDQAVELVWILPVAR